MDIGNIAEKLTSFVIFLPFFLLSVAAHEFGHALAAYQAGDSTAKYSGRLTLNPMMHIDPAGIMIFFFTYIFSPFVFGWAKPVPVNPLLFKHPQADTIKVSLAGVTANLILVVIFIVVMKVFIMTGVLGYSYGGFYSTGPISVWMYKLCSIIIRLNAVLMIFNLIPIPPLDGSKLLMALLPIESAKSFAAIEPYGMMIILAMIMFGGFSLILTPFMNLIMFFSSIIYAL